MTRGRALLPAVWCALASCASTPESAADHDAEQPYVAGLDGCHVQVGKDGGRTVSCGAYMGVLVVAGKESAQALTDLFLDGMAKGASVEIAREPGDRDIAGTVAPGTHLWFTNKNGVLVDGWVGVVSAGGQRRLIGCILLGTALADRCPALLAALRDAPLMAAGRYPVDVLGARALPAEGCELAPHRAACGRYELQWYEDGAGLTVERFVSRFEERGSAVIGRDELPCRALGVDARCEKVQLESKDGQVDVFFAYPSSGGVVLCIVERDQGLLPMCARFMSVEGG